MSLASQDIHEAMVARHEREQVELESKHDVQSELATFPYPDFFGSQDVEDGLLVARIKGSALVLSKQAAHRAVITFFEGRYEVAVYTV